jgi:protein TonB
MATAAPPDPAPPDPIAPEPVVPVREATQLAARDPTPPPRPSPAPRPAPPTRQASAAPRPAPPAAPARPTGSASASASASAPSGAAAADTTAGTADSSSPTARSATQGDPGGGRQAGLPAAYQALLRQILQRAHRVPAEAQERRLRGTALVQATITRNGRVVAHHLARSSGYQMLDEAALDLFRRVSPFPPFPSEYQADETRILVPVEFRSFM